MDRISPSPESVKINITGGTVVIVSPGFHCPWKFLQKPQIQPNPPSRHEIFTMKVSRSGGKEGHEEALNLFSLALEKDPNLAIAWVGRGFALGKLGRFEEEIECCKQAIELDRNCIDAWNDMAFAFGMLDRFEDKVECCEQALADRSGKCHRMEQQGRSPGDARQV